MNSLAFAEAMHRSFTMYTQQVTRRYTSFKETQGVLILFGITFSDKERIQCVSREMLLSPLFFGRLCLREDNDFSLQALANIKGRAFDVPHRYFLAGSVYA